MSVKYKLLKYHGHFSTRSEYRAVTIENQVVGINRIGRSIQWATSLTHADVIAAIAALRDEISSQLMSGNVVHLPGLGYFSLAVKGELHQDPRSGHFRLRKPEVRTVKFRPDMEMMETFLHTEFENVTYRDGISFIPTYKEIDKAIARLGTDKPFFSVDDLRLSLNLSQANAYRIAARLEEEGKIKNIGKGRNKLYVLGEHDGK